MEINVLMISNDKIGNESPELGAILLKSYLATLLENNNYTHIVLLNSGVKIACDGSNLIDDLKEIADKSKLLICQTCLNFYELDDKVLVGTRSNMKIISELLAESKKVVNI